MPFVEWARRGTDPYTRHFAHGWGATAADSYYRAYVSNFRVAKTPEKSTFGLSTLCMTLSL